MSDAVRPVTILIAALGGEGGGVLTSWIVQALESHGLIAQSTSIPGVAQRTGATTYYIETFPTPVAELGGRRPVLSLFPAVGDIDVMVASELVEAGRAIQGGYVTPERTTLIASTHRVFAIGERSGMADARIDSESVLAVAKTESRRALLDDYAGLARGAATTLNAVILGLIAGCGALPAPPEAFEGAIRKSNIAVEANLRGFALGVELAAKGDAARLPAPPEKRYRTRPVGAVEDRVHAELPDALHDVAIEAVRRLVEYQGTTYAGLYLDRLAPVCAAEDAAGGDGTLARETARGLALWMAYEDVIRVAQIKAAPERHARVLDEIGAGPDDPVRITEFFKPGIEELCSVLPSFVARPVLGLSARHGWDKRFHIGMLIKTTSINGYLRIWLLSKLRPWRPMTHRFREERIAIEHWLSLIGEAAKSNLALALEIAASARLIKGYGDTHARGRANYQRIVDDVIGPALAGVIPPDRAADAVANAAAAALADPTGARLSDVLGAIDRVATLRAAE